MGRVLRVGEGARGGALSRTRVCGSYTAHAMEVLAQEGWTGASTQANAERAGLSKARLNSNIESKEDLYRQVLQDIVDDWINVFGLPTRRLDRAKYWVTTSDAR